MNKTNIQVIKAISQYANQMYIIHAMPWPLEFKHSEMEKLTDGFIKRLKELNTLCETSPFLTVENEDLELFGCVPAFDSNDEEDNIMLLPKMFMEILTKGTKLKCIDGRTVIVGKDYIDDDDRRGLIAYGFPIDKYSKKEG